MNTAAAPEEGVLKAAPVEGAVKDAILIAGPTASGKSGQALRLAELLGGVVINTDSMQVYAQLEILTARPSREETERVPHRLYGHVDARQPYSTARWLDDVASLIAGGELKERRPVFVGGTGLYFKALTEGLSKMPAVADEIRQGWRDRLARDGAASLHARLAGMDPDAAKGIHASDGQRIVRALEVMESSGRSIRHWQEKRSPPLVDARTARKFVINADRSLLAERISARFDAMMEAGAEHEAQRLLGLGMGCAMPAMKAIGVPDMIDFCEGKVPLEEALRRAKAATRQYAKRQDTWFRNQMGPDWNRVEMGIDITTANL